jgi:hypothetical protein
MVRSSEFTMLKSRYAEVAVIAEDVALMERFVADGRH